MIILEPTLDPGAIPPELLDKVHATWSNPKRFSAWCVRHRIIPVAAETDWAQRFQAGRDGWAVNNAVVNGTNGNADITRLQQLGVPYSATRDRMRGAGMLADSFAI